MMGAVCFMVGGAMCCGVSGQALMVRVGREEYQRALTEPYVRPMEVGGRRPTGFVRVDPEGFAAEAALEAWVARDLLPCPGSTRTAELRSGTTSGETGRGRRSGHAGTPRPACAAASARARGAVPTRSRTPSTRRARPSGCKPTGLPPRRSCAPWCRPSAAAWMSRPSWTRRRTAPTTRTAGTRLPCSWCTPGCGSGSMTRLPLPTTRCWSWTAPGWSRAAWQQQP